MNSEAVSQVKTIVFDNCQSGIGTNSGQTVTLLLNLIRTDIRPSTTDTLFIHMNRITNMWWSFNRRQSGEGLWDIY